MHSNIANFPHRLRIEVEQVFDEYEVNPQKIFKFCQILCARFFSGKITKHRERGILLDWVMGQGKAMGSIYIAWETGRPVIAFMPKALENNYKAQIRMFCRLKRLPIEAVMNRFSFIALNAGNLKKQLIKLTGSESVEGYTIVIDEFHNLTRQVVNGSSNGLFLYYLLKNAIDVRIVLASGTPISKSPFEMVATVNILTGEDRLPENYSDFKEMFIEHEGAELEDIDVEAGPVNMDELRLRRPPMRLKNRSKLQNRMLGIISYAGMEPGQFPPELPTILRKVPMGETQYAAYKLAREKEIAEAKRKSGPMGIARMHSTVKAPPMQLSASKTGSSYRKESRSICNQYEEKSPKIDMLMKDVTDRSGKLIIYSQFREDGVFAIAERLKSLGYEEVFAPKVIKPRGAKKTPSIDESIDIIEVDETAEIDSIPVEEDEFDTISSIEDTDTTPIEDSNEDSNEVLDEAPIEDSNEDSIKGGNGGHAPIEKKALRFVMIHGEIDPDDRNALKDLFNRTENKFGEYIKVFLMTVTGAEGLNFNSIRGVYIFESYWVAARIAQVKARGIRTKSNDMLPEGERDVQPYIYLATAPYANEPLTSDEYLYEIAVINQMGLDDCLNVYKEVSIDCHHSLEAKAGQIMCKSCNPTNVKLFSDNIDNDMMAPDPCEAMKEVEVAESDISTIVVNDIEYKYTHANQDATESIYGLAVYKWNDDLKAFVRVLEDSPAFTDIYSAINRLGA